MNNKNNDNAKKLIGTLHNIINDIVTKYEKLEDNNCLPNQLQGKKSNFLSLISLIGKIKRQHYSNTPKTIGFFGAQKRGKSSLINCLLGCDLMPVGVVPKSSVVIKTAQDNTCKPDIFKIEIHKASRPIIVQEAKNVKQAADILKVYASHSGALSQNVDEVLVTSLFPNSKILENGGVLVDTPGAEYVFPDDCKNISEAEIRNSKDLNQALNILDKTEIILFVERADYLQGKKNYEFYQDKIQCLNPLNIINFKDKCPNDESFKPEKNEEILESLKSEYLISKMVSTFGARIDRTICVSSKEAKQNTEQSNIHEIETRIIEEIDSLKPEKGLERCLRELTRYLKQFNCKEILPDKLKLHTFKALLEKHRNLNKFIILINEIDRLSN